MAPIECERLGRNLAPTQLFTLATDGLGGSPLRDRPSWGWFLCVRFRVEMQAAITKDPKARFAGFSMHSAKSRPAMPAASDHVLSFGVRQNSAERSTPMDIKYIGIDQIDNLGVLG
jgi:hypothetical protein